MQMYNLKICIDLLQTGQKSAFEIGEVRRLLEVTSLFEQRKVKRLLEVTTLQGITFLSCAEYMPNLKNLAYLSFTQVSVQNIQIKRAENIYSLLSLRVCFERILRFFLAILLFSSFFLQAFLPLKAQTSDTTFHIVKQFPFSPTFLTTDALQQIYLATEEGQILKLDKDGTLLFEYNNDRLGNIGTIDATNPFTILVYYPDLASIILLDRTLSPIKEINLLDLAIFEPPVVAMANDNTIWLYDPINYQLKKINKAGKIIFQSRRLNQVIQAPIQANFLLERNNQLFLNDPVHGIFIFDGFGQLKQQVPITRLPQFQVLNNQLVYFKEGVLKRFSLDVLEEENVAVPFNMEGIEMILPMKGQFLVVKQNEVLLVE